MKANYATREVPEVSFKGLSGTNKLKHLLKYAVLAPSAHNTQPWLFRLVNDSTLTVELNRNRTLGISDPTHRQAFMSLGAAIENLKIAAAHYGGTVSVATDTSSTIIGIKWDAKSSSNRDQFYALLKRHTNRGDYHLDSIEEELRSKLDKLQAGSVKTLLITDADQKKSVAELAFKANLQVMNASFKQELAKWVHSNWTNEYTGMPASVQGIASPISLFAKKIISNAPIEKAQAKKDKQQIIKTPALVIVTGSVDRQEVWIQAGQIFERICIEAAAKGYSTSAYATLIESTSIRHELQNLLSSDIPMAVLRVGKPTKTFPATPRLPVEMVTEE